MNRRQALALISTSVLPLRAAHAYETRRLNLYCPHTDESCFVAYYSNGSYLQDGLFEIFYLMRDRRTGHIRPIDTRVLDVLHAMMANLDRDIEQIHILSGYRTTQTNELLARSSSSVAKNSYHLKGQAVDCNVPGVTTVELRKAARVASSGGVGFYPNSNFIHIDSGPYRDWVS